jgi:hypothetical protein
MNRSSLAWIVLVTLAASGFAPTARASSNEFFDGLRAARRLVTQGDLLAARERFNAINHEGGGHPSALWNLARIAAMRGQEIEAVQRLEEFAAMGLAAFPGRDSAFVALSADRRFQAVELRLAKNAAPLANASVAYSLRDPGLLAEDLAYDERTRTLYVSSIHRRAVLAIDSTGAIRDFVPSGRGEIWGVYALALDLGRGWLWGSMAAGPTCAEYDVADSGRTALVCWELSSGTERQRVEFPRDGGKHVLGDITLGADVTVFATESIGGGLYALRPGADALETVAPPGTFGSPQSPVVLPGGRMSGSEGFRTSFRKRWPSAYSRRTV